MESSAMPASLAAWKIFPSTSMLTALVHSSRRAYLGLGVMAMWVKLWASRANAPGWLQPLRRRQGEIDTPIPPGPQGWGQASKQFCLPSSGGPRERGSGNSWCLREPKHLVTGRLAAHLW